MVCECVCGVYAEVSMYVVVTCNSTTEIWNNFYSCFKSIGTSRSPLLAHPHKIVSIKSHSVGRSNVSPKFKSSIFVDIAQCSPVRVLKHIANTLINFPFNGFNTAVRQHNLNALIGSPYMANSTTNRYHPACVTSQFGYFHPTISFGKFDRI